MPTKEDIVNALSKVVDPEIGISVIDLGLIYGIEISNGKVLIKMTLTSPYCPLSRLIVSQVKQAVEKVEGVENVEIKLVWDPPWSPAMMSKRAKKLLGME